MPENVRTIKRFKDGAIKRVREGAAANMVARGLCEYVDDGPDNSELANKGKQKTLTALESRPTPTVDLTTKMPIQKLPPSKTAVKMANKQPTKVSNPPTPIKQKVIKKDTIPKEKLDAVRALNTSQQAPALNTQGDGFSRLVENTRSKLQKTRTQIPIKVPDKK
jgi:hypothetical protein